MEAAAGGKTQKSTTLGVAVVVNGTDFKGVLMSS